MKNLKQVFKEIADDLEVIDAITEYISPLQRIEIERRLKRLNDNINQLKLFFRISDNRSKK